MQTPSRNKAIGTPPASKSEAPAEIYHFAGGGEYKPCAVSARSREEAEREWEKVRVKVTE